MLTLPIRSEKQYASLIFSEGRGDFQVDSFSLTPSTLTEVVGLGLAFAAFLAGIFTMGTLL